MWNYRLKKYIYANVHSGTLNLSTALMAGHLAKFDNIHIEHAETFREMKRSWHPHSSNSDIPWITVIGKILPPESIHVTSKTEISHT